jgi:hypothetical protein
LGDAAREVRTDGAHARALSVGCQRHIFVGPKFLTRRLMTITAAIIGTRSASVSDRVISCEAA